MHPTLSATRYVKYDSGWQLTASGTVLAHDTKRIEYSHDEEYTVFARGCYDGFGCASLGTLRTQGGRSPPVIGGRLPMSVPWCKPFARGPASGLGVLVDDLADEQPARLRALLIPPQEERLRSRFDLVHAPLDLITSGWHRLVVAAPDRVFVFPRNALEVPGIEREARVLTLARLMVAPRLLGLHREPSISPYPFLELTRIPGRPYDAIADRLAGEDAAAALADLGRQIAQWHCAPTPPSLAAAPAHREPPRVSGRWVEPAGVEEMVAWAAEALSPYLARVPKDAWLEVLHEVAAMAPVTVHGELSDGQFLLDRQYRVTGVVDWDALHLGHPLLDFNFGVGGVGVHRDSGELRSLMWMAYVTARGGDLPGLAAVETFWALLDATTLIHTDSADLRLSKAVVQLAQHGCRA